MTYQLTLVWLLLVLAVCSASSDYRAWKRKN